MEVLCSKAEIRERRPSAAALGFFDGLHIGHARLIDECVFYAKQHGLSADVFTFREHPKNIMCSKLVIPRLCTEAEKLCRIENDFVRDGKGGVDRVFDFDFADGFHTMTPDAFAKDLLKGAFCVEAVFCGFDFRFGADAAGDANMLVELGERYGFDIFVLDPVYLEGQLVSSTLVRSLIESGDVELANKMLGRGYSLAGVVEKGRKLGRVLGFPTANFAPDPELTLPELGVYATVTEIVKGAGPEDSFLSVTNVGTAPTVCDSKAVRIETHLLGDPDRVDSEANGLIELYGEHIRVKFMKMLRKEQRFDNKEELVSQIAADKEAALQYLQTNEKKSALPG